MTNTEIPNCPKCSNPMIVKEGRYGQFWGCSKYPKCKGLIDIPKRKLFAPKIENVEDIKTYEPDEFLNSDVFQKLKEIVGRDDFPTYAKPIIEFLEEGFYPGKVDEDSVRGKVSGLLDYLKKKEKKKLLFQFSYYIYKIEGEKLPERFYGFLWWSLYRTDDIKHKEGQIVDAIMRNWDNTFLSKRMGLELLGKENFIGRSRVDIVARKDEKQLFAFEVKSPKVKGKTALGQAMKVKQFFINNSINGASYIIAAGCPEDIIDPDIGVIGYTVDKDTLCLILWKEAKNIQ